MNLSIDYLGKRFDNPFVLASGPPTASAEMIKRAFEAGWAGAVIKTLIREPVENLHNRFAVNKINNTIYAFENVELLSEKSPEMWYEDILELKKSFPDKIIIGSIMGDAKTREQWIELALICQEAGADFIELNFSCPHGYPEKGKGSAIGQSADYSSAITKWLKNDKKITVPIIPKLTAAVTDISFIGEAVASAGADGLCAINTFPSIMGFDLKTLEPKPAICGHTTSGGYSGPGLKPIALKCISDLIKSPALPVMASGGVSSGFDAVEFILAGATLVQVCTAVMLKGYSIITQMQNELEEFMESHDFTAVSDFICIGNQNVCQFSELDHNFSVKASIDPEKCVGCGLCFTSCRDGGRNALAMRNEVAVVDYNKCGGCSLCFQVCPTGAITMEKVQIAG